MREQIDTTDERVMALALPWVQVFDSETARLVIGALLREAGQVGYNAGQQLALHEVIQILRLIELTRPYHEDSMHHHAGDTFTTRGQWSCRQCKMVHPQHKMDCSRGR